MLALKDKISTLLEYKVWANKITYETVLLLPEFEVLKDRPTRFGNIIHTLNHVYVIDDVFKSHLSGKKHHYIARNTEASPTRECLWDRQKQMDLWYQDYLKDLPDDSLDQIIKFQFIGGGKGEMSIADVLIHVVNHGTYHRGFVGDMMYQIPIIPPANDYSVFLRKDR